MPLKKLNLLYNTGSVLQVVHCWIKKKQGVLTRQGSNRSFGTQEGKRC